MKKIKLTKENIALVAILVLSSVLNLFNLGIEGYANLYYASGVKSMTMSLKNFFFVSFDPAGFVSIDKPPVGLWLQAISAKIFGYSGFSIILPQAVAGILSVYILYKLVKKSFGTPSGLLSGLFLAVTPVFVAVSRNNTIDNVLVLVLLLACYALSFAVEKGKLKYLILSIVLVGIGFNVKMLQAYMIAPALYITYLLSCNISVKRRILNLIVSTFILILVSLSWALVVDIVPASMRPYVDSSTNNTVMELIVGHNGTERLGLTTNSKDNKNSGGGPNGQNQGNFNATQNNNQPTASNNLNNSNNNSVDGNSGATVNENGAGGPGGNGNFSGRQNGYGPGPGMQRGFNGGGNPNFGGRNNGNGGGNNGLSGSFGADTKSGITRLFSKNILSDQIVWFIPLAFIGFIAASIREKLRFRLDNKRKQALVLWFMWLLPVFVYFSFNTGLFHSYYLTMLAPPVAALAGIGIVSMWESYKEGNWQAWFLPAAILADAGVQLLMLSYFYNTSKIILALEIILILLSVIPTIILIGLKLFNRKNEFQLGKTSKKFTVMKFKKLLIALVIGGLIVSPLTGSGASLFKAISATFPAAGLELLSGNQKQEGNSNSLGDSDDGLIKYLQSHKTNEKYLLVVASINSAEGIIIKTGEAVMSLGGFMGNDKILTLDEFKALVKKGEVRYVLVDGMGGRGDDNEITNWAAKNGKLISSSEYSSNINNQNGGFRGNSGQLYDLKGFTK